MPVASELQYGCCHLAIMSLFMKRGIMVSAIHTWSLLSRKPDIPRNAYDRFIPMSYQLGWSHVEVPLPSGFWSGWANERGEKGLKKESRELREFPPCSSLLSHFSTATLAVAISPRTASPAEHPPPCCHMSLGSGNNSITCILSEW